MRISVKTVRELVDRYNNIVNSSNYHIVFTSRYGYYAIDKVYANTGCDTIETGLTIREAYYVIRGMLAAIN